MYYYVSSTVPNIEANLARSVAAANSADSTSCSSGCGCTIARQPEAARLASGDGVCPINTAASRAEAAADLIAALARWAALNFGWISRVSCAARSAAWTVARHDRRPRARRVRPSSDRCLARGGGGGVGSPLSLSRVPFPPVSDRVSSSVSSEEVCPPTKSSGLLVLIPLKKL